MSSLGPFSGQCSAQGLLAHALPGFCMIKAYTCSRSRRSTMHVEFAAQLQGTPVQDKDMSAGTGLTR